MGIRSLVEVRTGSRKNLEISKCRKSLEIRSAVRWTKWENRAVALLLRLFESESVAVGGKSGSVPLPSRVVASVAIASALAGVFSAVPGPYVAAAAIVVVTDAAAAVCQEWE